MDNRCESEFATIGLWCAWAQRTARRLKSIDEVKKLASQILGMQLKTHQTGPQGQKVRRLLVEEGAVQALKRGQPCTSPLASRHAVHVGLNLIFLVPGRGDTLRVNGRAAIVRDEEILSRTAMHGKLPKVGIGVEVEEAYLHCPKAFLRSSLWDASTWADAQKLPSFAQMLWDQVPNARLGATSVDQYASDLAKRVRETLY